MWAIRRGEEVIKMDDLIIDCFAGGGGAPGCGKFAEVSR